MTVANTSITAYSEHKNSGKVGRQASFVLKSMEQNKDYSRKELSKLTGIELSAICGRVNELLKTGMLIETTNRACEITNKTIKPVKKV